jgi:hypothetical protein
MTGLLHTLAEDRSPMSPMPRPSLKSFFLQNLKSDAFYADEWINIYLLRPIAAGIVWIIYPTRISPNMVTVTAILIGFCAALTYLFDTTGAIALAGTLVLLKDIFDDADGQLARVKQQYSRRGRFLDSIGDFLVDVAIFSSITYIMFLHHPTIPTIFLGFCSLAGTTLRVSYHVFYQASFLHGENRYDLNRIIETITEEDRRGDKVALNLQRLFIVIYNWQDRLMYRIDRWCMGKNFDERHLSVWYGDRMGLRLSGFLGFGTEFIILAICSWWNQLYFYFFLNVIMMNAIFLTSILYKKLILSVNIPRKIY